LIGGVFDPDTDPDADKVGMVLFTVPSTLMSSNFVLNGIQIENMISAIKDSSAVEKKIPRGWYSKPVWELD
jgi:hypothetical protein